MEIPQTEVVEVNGCAWRAVDAEALGTWLEGLEHQLAAAHEEDPYITLTENALREVRACLESVRARV